MWTLYIKLNSLKWTGLVIRKKPIEISKKVTTMQPEDRKKKERKFEIEMEEKISCDANACCIKNLRMATLDSKWWKIYSISPRLTNEELLHPWWWCLEQVCRTLLKLYYIKPTRQNCFLIKMLQCKFSLIFVSYLNTFP